MTTRTRSRRALGDDACAARASGASRSTIPRLVLALVQRRVSTTARRMVSPMGWVPQTYLPEGRRYYEPVDRGHEALIRQRLEALRQLQREAMIDDDKPEQVE